MTSTPRATQFLYLAGRRSRIGNHSMYGAEIRNQGEAPVPELTRIRQHSDLSGGGDHPLVKLRLHNVERC